jgi:hypothetical protein
MMRFQLPVASPSFDSPLFFNHWQMLGTHINAKDCTHVLQPEA